MGAASSVYVLVTPAKNEEAVIKATIESVVSQTVKPSRWVIVSDNSSDSTDDIVKDYARKHDFIEYVRREGSVGQNFGAKARAFMDGYSRLAAQPFEFIGNLDADTALPSDYYERILQQFHKESSLGIAGGEILELHNNHYRSRVYSVHSVAGAVQLFRRECFLEVGGYIPIKCGGIDAVAETKARMGGWLVRTYPHVKAYHNRLVGSTDSSVLRGRFRCGVRDNLLGNHPVFMIGKCVRLLRDRPLVVGSVAMGAGFFNSYLRRDERPVSAEFVRFTREMQLRRMRRMVLDVLLLGQRKNPS